MRMAEIIEAVLEKDLPALRNAFDELVTLDGSTMTNLPKDAHPALVNEVCFALAEDTALLDDRLCGFLALPAGSDFARGVAKVIALRLSFQQYPSDLGPKS